MQVKSYDSHEILRDSLDGASPGIKRTNQQSKYIQQIHDTTEENDQNEMLKNYNSDVTLM